MSGTRTHARVDADPVLQVTCILQPTISHPQTMPLANPYQCLFVPSAQKGMGREKIAFVWAHDQCSANRGKIPHFS